MALDSILFLESVTNQFQGNFEESFIAKVRKDRAVLVLENHCDEACISEKVFIAYSASGVVPMYHGAPDVHMWQPHVYGCYRVQNTTSPSQLCMSITLPTMTPKRKGTSYYIDHYCPFNSNFVCHLCCHAYKLKMDYQP